MCLSTFPGARAVCAGSEEARALIKEQAWYRDASLTALGDVQPDGVQMRATPPGLLSPDRRGAAVPVAVTAQL